VAHLSIRQDIRRHAYGTNSTQPAIGCIGGSRDDAVVDIAYFLGKNVGLKAGGIQQGVPKSWPGLPASEKAGVGGYVFGRAKLG
jgi:hypothetical protein